jgi:CO dehydrogenase/acetyl-CoA synthase gamma subunit (corrinoid Fe-S protein)
MILYWLLSIAVFSLITNFAITIAVVKGKLPKNNITKFLKIVLPIIGMSCVIWVAFL